MPKRNNSKSGLPWLRKLANGTLRWYLPMSGKGENPVPMHDKHGNFIDGPENEALAMQAWHVHCTLDRAAIQGEDNLVVVILEKYLQYLKDEGSVDGTMEVNTRHFQSFAEMYPSLTVRDIKPSHIKDWWKAHPTWGEGTQRTVAVRIMGALNWAAGAESGNLIPKNTLKGMRLPAARSRSEQVVLDADERRRAIDALPAYLRDAFITMHETGCRPGSVRVVEARHCHLDEKIWILDTHKTKRRTGRDLTVFLTPNVVDICRRLMAQYPEGKLFRTETGLDWTEKNMSSVFCYWAGKLGLKGRMIAYGGRHTRITNLLESEVPDYQVARLAGHSSTRMVYTNYDHAKHKMLTDIQAKHSPEAAKTEIPDCSWQACLDAVSGLLPSATVSPEQGQGIPAESTPQASP